MTNLQIHITNLPKFASAKAVIEHVSSAIGMAQAQVFCKRKPAQCNFANIEVQIPEDQGNLGIEEIINKITGSYMNKSRIYANVQRNSNESNAKKPRIQSEVIKCLNDQVTPLWKMSYPEQLLHKQDKMRRILDNLKADLTNASNESETATSLNTDCLEEIKSSPTIDGYRNKCDFTIGTKVDESGNLKPAVGFSLGGFKDGEDFTKIGDITDCKHVSDHMKAFVKHFESFLEQHMELPVYNRLDKSGVWRLLLLREHMNQLMVLVQIQGNPKASEEEKSSRQKIQQEIIEMCKAFLLIPVTSVYVQYTTQVHDGLDNRKESYFLIDGNPTLTDKVGGLVFQISPASFFQVNDSATPILYDTIVDYALENTKGQDEVILDLCCGTGTIGMLVAKRLLADNKGNHKVYGIDIVEDAIKDAKLNAETNNIPNGMIEFISGPVEKVLLSDSHKHILSSEKEYIVILDPPRAGVHSSVTKAIRSCKNVKRVVYVSCAPEQALRNWVELSRPSSKAYIGYPFKLTKSVAIDLFPHTNHCELVLQFERE